MIEYITTKLRHYSFQFKITSNGTIFPKIFFCFAVSDLFAHSSTRRGPGGGGRHTLIKPNYN
jgi:hypothetical protein